MHKRFKSGLSVLYSLLGLPGYKPCWFSESDVLGTYHSGIDLEDWIS